MLRHTCSPMKGEKSDSFLKKPLQTAQLPSLASSLSTTPSFRLTLNTLSLLSSAEFAGSMRAVSLPYKASLQAAPVETSSKRDMMTNESCKGNQRSIIQICDQKQICWVRFLLTLSAYRGEAQGKEVIALCCCPQ